MENAVYVGAALVACCMAASVFAENAGTKARNRRWQRVHSASQWDEFTQWTNRRQPMDIASGIKLPADGYCHCLTCNAPLESPIGAMYGEEGRMHVEFFLCCDCWEIAVREGVSMYIQPGHLLKAKNEVDSTN